MYISSITFCGKPYNYRKIDNIISRSSQPLNDDFAWLKNQGVSDIINFRTMFVPNLDFNEQKVVEELGMHYHNIPSVTKQPLEENIIKFLQIINSVKNKGGKVHIHCKAGADRTGMYSYIYKMLNGIGSRISNEAEMIQLGHNTKRYPDLLPWINKYLDKNHNIKVSV